MNKTPLSALGAPSPSRGRLSANAASAEAASEPGDIAALARGGRTNVFGFVLRLSATAPFLFIAGRLYGAAALGRFASALVAVELAALVCTLGQKRGLAQRLSQATSHPTGIVADALVLGTVLSMLGTLLLVAVPGIMFPHGGFSAWDLALPAAILPSTLGDLGLAALAYRYDVATTVRTRSVIEPWTQSIIAGLAWFVVPEGGLAIAYIAAKLVAGLWALGVLTRSYGWPARWAPHPARIARLAMLTAPLAVADAVEWGTRKLDIFILRFFVSDTVVGIYYVAQQVATLPQKLKTSFEPILGPVITRNLAEGNRRAIARQVSQVGFWITAAQAGIALALGIPAAAVLAAIGPRFSSGALALDFLLAAEVVAATAVVSEAALIYIAPLRNVVVSLATILLQAALTLAGMAVDHGMALDDTARGASAAGALLVTLAVASRVKRDVLARRLGERVTNWRWPLFWAAAPAGVVGWAAVRFLPSWAQLALGVPAILGMYGWVIWCRGFGPEDRLLFRLGSMPAPENHP